MKHLLFFLLFSNILLVKAQEESPYLEVWTLQTDDSFINSNAHRIASKKWPFTIYSMSGTIILDEKIVDSVQKNNQNVWQYLNNHGQHDAKKAYLKDFYSEKKELTKAIKISQANLDLSEYKPKNISYLHAQFHTGVTKIKEHIYQFVIYVVDYNKPYNQESVLVKYTVNTETEKITILNKQ